VGVFNDEIVTQDRARAKWGNYSSLIKCFPGRSKFVAKTLLAEGLLRAVAGPRIVEPKARVERRRVLHGAGAMAQQDELSDEERQAILRHIERLREEHRDLDAAIDALLQSGQADRLQVQRLKKRKLQLRDKLSQLEDTVTPDIIA
jgi:hypothetical protein